MYSVYVCPYLGDGREVGGDIIIPNREQNMNA